MKRMFIASVAAVALATTAAFAVVTFDPATGTGFVGKGDVQLAFGWNNAQLQKNAIGVTFTYDLEGQYAQSCMKELEKKTNYKDFKKSVDVNATITYESRVQKGGVQQITGFNLLGFGPSSGDEVPTDLCNPGGADPSGWVVDPDGEYPNVTQIGGGTGGLFVHYSGQSKLLQ